MQPKYCRYCNALVQPPEPGVAAPDFCNDEHRRQYHDKIQRETIERLRRAERSSGSASTQGGSATAVVTTRQAPLTKPAAVESTLAGLSHSVPPAVPPAAPPPAAAKTDKDSLASLLRSARTKIAEKKGEGSSSSALPALPSPDMAAGQPLEIAPIEIEAVETQSAPMEPVVSVRSVGLVREALAPDVSQFPVEPLTPQTAAEAALRMSPPHVSVPPIRTRPVIKESAPPAAKEAPKEASREAKPPVKPAAQPSPKAAPRKPAAPAPVEREERVSEPVYTEAPSLGASVGAGGGWMMKAAAAAMLVAAGGGYYFWQGGSAAATAVPKRAAAAPILMSPMGWSNTAGTGKNDRDVGRSLTLYRPSLELSDYRVNFTGEIQHRALGWVFRVKDPSNYYAAKLVPVPGGKVQLMRWIVANGVALDQVTVPLDIPPPSNGKFKVQIDAKGPRFQIQVQGQQADSWTDTRFASGGFGLANENTERSKVTEVQIAVFGSGH